MPKTVSPGHVRIPGRKEPFHASALPDPFDARDLEYRPRLQPLPDELDVRPRDKAAFAVMTQTGNSCTGHAVAAMINNVLYTQHKAVKVSPYMLYAMARRYDEFAGDADEGSSLRGALKGWYYHGVLPQSRWPALDPAHEPDIGDPILAEEAMNEPLGAFYRVNAFRLDDMQSAINELHAVVVSAAVHEGWAKPTVLEHTARNGKAEHIAVIERPPSAQPLGGHAFAIVGYNDVGFLVQNSWGEQWGRGGFATLTYDDWLASAYDAWVARPGVRSIVSQRNHRQTVKSTTGEVASAPGPDLQRLDRHVVNLGNNGQLSTTGRFSSTPEQIDRIFARMKDYHDYWAAHPGNGGGTPPRRIVLYAHGGLNSESTGLSIAWHQLNWWLNNRVFPITFAWQSGSSETLMDQLTDLTHPKLPAGGLGFDLVEQFDRLVEKVARVSARWMWDEMKENANRASGAIDASKVTWPTPAGKTRQAMAAMPGASLTATRLKQYVDAHPGEVEVHLVGHSAGSIFHGALLERLGDIPLTSVNFMAPAIRTDTFIDEVVPRIAAHSTPTHAVRFASFGLDDKRELDDVCGAGGKNVYHKSLLYLVSHALEHPAKDQSEVPLLGMQKFVSTKVSGTTLKDALHKLDSALVWAPSEKPANCRTDSTSHGGFDDDSPTMTSVMLRLLGSSTPSAAMRYQAFAQRIEPEPPASAGVPAPPTRTTPALTPADMPAQGAAPAAEVAASSPAPQAAADEDEYSVDLTVAALQHAGWKRNTD